jgi:hypothetical protein
MFRSRPGARAIAVLSLVSTLCAEPVLAAQDYREHQLREMNRAAFAGAVLRLETGKAAKAPATRLQLGMRSVPSGPQFEPGLQSTHIPMLELGLAGKDRGTFLVAGQPTSQFKRRLATNGDAGTTLIVVFSVALLAVGLLVITNLDSLDEN